VGYEQLMDSLNRLRRRKQHSLPKPPSPQNLLYGRHIESELGIDVMTILECVWGKGDRCNLWITYSGLKVSITRVVRRATFTRSL
jgi:hypothetical protein